MIQVLINAATFVGAVAFCAAIAGATCGAVAAAKSAFRWLARRRPPAHVVDLTTVRWDIREASCSPPPHLHPDHR